MTYKTFGYFPNYRIYGSNYQPENINWDLIDIGFYAFGQVGNIASDQSQVASDWAKYNGTIASLPNGQNTYATGQYNQYVNGQRQLVFSTDPYADFDIIPSPPYKTGTIDEWSHGKNAIGRFIEGAHKAGKKAILTLGGWSNSIPLLYGITSSDRDDLINDIINYINIRVPAACKGAKFDGIDIDLEPYANNWQKMNVNELNRFIEFLAKLKKALPVEQNTLSIAITGTPSNIDYIENTLPGFTKAVNAVVDYIVLMQYDFHGFFDYPGVSNFQSALYTDPKDPTANNKFNVNDGVVAFITKGFDSNKLLLGCPAYGRTFAVSDDGSVPYQQFLNLSYDAPLYDNPTTNIAVQGNLSSSIVNLVNNQTFKEVNYYNDSKQFVGSYAYGNYQGQNIFISYDNPGTVTEKCMYVKNHGLGGAGLYDLGGDCNSTLIKAISTELK